MLPNTAPLPTPSRLWAFLFAALLCASASCGNGGSSDEDNGRCPEGESIVDHAGIAACQPICESDEDCSEGRLCRKDHCLVPIDGGADAGDDVSADSESDGTSGGDAGCPEGTEKTDYHGVIKCRQNCEETEECPGELECLRRVCVDRSLRPDAGVDADGGADTTDQNDEDTGATERDADDAGDSTNNG